MTKPVYNLTTKEGEYYARVPTCTACGVEHIFVIVQELLVYVLVEQRVYRYVGRCPKTHKYLLLEELDDKD